MGLTLMGTNFHDSSSSDSPWQVTKIDDNLYTADFFPELATVGGITIHPIVWTLSDGTEIRPQAASISDGVRVPEPATMFLFGVSLMGLAGIGRKMKRMEK